MKAPDHLRCPYCGKGIVQKGINPNKTHMNKCEHRPEVFKKLDGKKT